MRPISAILSLAPTAVGIPAVASGALPPWFIAVMLTMSFLLAAGPVVVTQIVRLRASAQIDRSQDAVKVLEIEDRRRRQV